MPYRVTTERSENNMLKKQFASAIKTVLSIWKVFEV